MSEYMPTTDEIRTEWVAHTAQTPEGKRRAAAAFNDWLAAHDREVVGQAFPISREAYDNFIEKLSALIPEGDEATYSNPEGAVESIIVDCFTAYRARLDSVQIIEREVAAKAWDEGYSAGGDWDRDVRHYNPYEPNPHTGHIRGGAAAAGGSDE